MEYHTFSTCFIWFSRLFREYRPSGMEEGDIMGKINTDHLSGNGAIDIVVGGGFLFMCF